MFIESFVELVLYDFCGLIEKRGIIGGEGVVFVFLGGMLFKNFNCNMIMKVSIYFFYKVYLFYYFLILNFKYLNCIWCREMSN